MGKFFTNLFVKNDSANQSTFVETFKNMMLKKGYDVCNSDDSEKTFILMFNSAGKWVVISNEEYSQNEKIAIKECAEFSKDMKTTCISATVVDSDFVMLTLNSRDKTDTLYLGEPYDKFSPSSDILF